MEPFVTDQSLNFGMPGQHLLNAFPACFDKNAEPKRLMHPPGAVMQGLEWQSHLQVPTITLPNAEGTHYVMDRLITASVKTVVHRRSVVLKIDPVGHDHRCGHDQLQNGARRILSSVVVVQERATVKVDCLRTVTRGDNERSIPRPR